MFHSNHQERRVQLKLIREETEPTGATRETKSRFSSTVSHEPPAPPTSIRALLDLRNTGVPGEVPDDLQTASTIAARNGQRLADLTDDPLDLRRIEASEMAFNLETLTVGELVKEANLGAKSDGEQFGIHVTMGVPRDEGQIRGDQSRQMPVINNPLSNLLKFGQEGSAMLVWGEPRGKGHGLTFHVEFDRTRKPIGRTRQNYPRCFRPDRNAPDGRGAPVLLPTCPKTVEVSDRPRLHFCTATMGNI